MVDEFYLVECERIGSDPVDGRIPVAAGTRLSKADWDSDSDAPRRHVRAIARWCAEYGRRPVYLCAEVCSGRRMDEDNPRPQFAALYELAQDPDASFQEIVYYDAYRMTRRHLDGMLVLDACELTGKDLHFVVSGPPVLLNTMKKQFLSQQFFAAEVELEAIRRRARDKARSIILEQRRPARGLGDDYGHQPTFASRETPKGVRQITSGAKLVDGEWQVIREAGDRVLQGEALYSVVVDFNERGFRTRAGSLWDHPRLRNMLIAPRVAGLERLPDDSPALKRAAPQYAPVNIEPIFSRDEWQQLVQRLEISPHRTTHRQYLCTHLAVCEPCGAHLHGSYSHSADRPMYKCSRPKSRNRRRSGAQTTLVASDGHRHPTIRMEILDRVVAEVTLAAAETLRPLAEQRHAEMVAEDEQLARLQAERESLVNRRRLITRAWTDGGLDDGEYEAELDRLHDSETEINRRIAQLQAMPSRELELADLRELYATRDTTWRRALIDRFIEKVTISPAPTKGALTEHEHRISFTFRPGCEVPESAIREIAQRLADERLAPVRLHLSTINTTLPPHLDDIAFGLHNLGMTRPRIGRELIRLGHTPPRNGKKWCTGSVDSMLLRAHLRRGLTYQPTPPSKLITPSLQARIAELRDGKPSLTFQRIAEQLEEDCIGRPDGKEWNAAAVSYIYRTLDQRRYATQAKTPHITRILALRASGHTYTQIQHELRRANILAPRGGALWPIPTLQSICARSGVVPATG